MADSAFEWVDILQGFGTGLAAGAKMQGGKMAYQAAQISAANAQFQGDMANLAMQEKAYLFLQEGVRMKSSQVTSAAAAGVALDSQTLQLIQLETQQNFYADAQRMFKQGEIYSMTGQINALSAQLEGQAARTSGNMGAMSEIVKGVTGIMSMWGKSGK